MSRRAPIDPSPETIGPFEPGSWGRELLADGFVFAAVLWTHAQALGADYLVADDFMFVGLDRSSLWLQPGRSATYFGLASGRWLGGLLLALHLSFTSKDPARIRLVRLVSLILLALAAVVTRRLLGRSLRGTILPALLAIAIFSARPFATIAGYSFTMLWTPAAVLASLAAFALVVPSPATAGPVSWGRLAAAFACLLAALQVNQAVALFGLVPALAAALADRPKRRADLFRLLALMIAAFALEVAIYATGLRGLHAAGTQGYVKGEGAMSLAASPLSSLLSALDPRHYWPAFRLWSFPWPLERVRPLGPRSISWAFRVMAAWTLLVVAAAVAEARRRRLEPGTLARKWATVLVVMALAAIPILAESARKIPGPWFSSHVLPVSTGVVIAAAGWALREIAAGWPTAARRAGALACAVMVGVACAGARSDVRRGMIAPGEKQVAFVRAALSDCADSSRILVVLPERNGCPFEPCEVLQGSFAPDPFHASRPDVYRFERAIACGGPHRPIAVEFTKASPTEPPPEGTVVVDWNDHVRGEAKRLGVPWRSLRPEGPHPDEPKASPTRGPPPDPNGIRP